MCSPSPDTLPSASSAHLNPCNEATTLLPYGTLFVNLPTALLSSSSCRTLRRSARVLSVVSWIGVLPACSDKQMHMCTNLLVFYFFFILLLLIIWGSSASSTHLNPCNEATPLLPYGTLFIDLPTALLSSSSCRTLRRSAKALLSGMFLGVHNVEGIRGWTLKHTYVVYWRQVLTAEVASLQSRYRQVFCRPFCL